MIPNNRNRPADIWKLDGHDWYGNLISRAKAKSTEKEKIILMIDQLANSGDVKDEDITFVKRSDVRIEEEKKLFRPFSNDWKRNLNWKKDQRGV